MSWQNWARSVTADPGVTVSPADEDEVTQALSIAAARGIQVRAVGSGHSFTPVAATGGMQLRTDRLSGLRAVDAATRRVAIGGGTKLRDIAALLRPHGLAMTNLGDIDAQSIAGAISTGTHGTGAAFTGLSGQVRGLRLVLADGSVVNCSEAERPELFSAARLGLGAFGIISEVTLQCVPTFMLEADERPEPLDAVLDSFVDRSRECDHLEFYWFPHTETALMKAKMRLPGDATPEPLGRLRAWWDDELISNTAFGMICAAGHLVPSVTPLINRASGRLVSQRRFSGDSADVFTATRRVRFREMEYSIEPAALREVITGIRTLIDSGQQPISFPIEVRIAAADDIPLSTAHRRESVYVAVHRYWRDPFARYFLAVEEILAAAGGRPHWGKLHTMDRTRLAERYHRWDDVMAVRRAVDPDGRFGNAYLERIWGSAAR